jgi:hypothetical protein
MNFKMEKNVKEGQTLKEGLYDSSKPSHILSKNQD